MFHCLAAAAARPGLGCSARSDNEAAASGPCRGHYCRLPALLAVLALSGVLTRAGPWERDCAGCGRTDCSTARVTWEACMQFFIKFKKKKKKYYDNNFTEHRLLERLCLSYAPEARATCAPDRVPLHAPVVLNLWRSERLEGRQHRTSIMRCCRAASLSCRLRALTARFRKRSVIYFLNVKLRAGNSLE